MATWQSDDVGVARWLRASVANVRGSGSALMMRARGKRQRSQSAAWPAFAPRSTMTARVAVADVARTRRRRRSPRSASSSLPSRNQNQRAPERRVRPAPARELGRDAPLDREQLHGRRRPGLGSPVLPPTRRARRRLAPALAATRSMARRRPRVRSGGRRAAPRGGRAATAGRRAAASACVSSPSATPSALHGAPRGADVLLGVEHAAARGDRLRLARAGGRAADVVDGRAARSKRTVMPASADALAEVGVLAVEEEALVEAADRLEGVAADEHARARHPLGLARAARRRRGRGRARRSTAPSGHRRCRNSAWA